MFSALKRNWREARAIELRKEWDDLVLRMAGGSTNFQIRLIDRIEAFSKWLVTRYRSLDNISDAEKRALVKDLKKLVRSRFDTDLGGSYAAAVIACNLESQTLPGDDAAYVRELSQIMIEAASEQCRILEANIA